MRGKWTVSNELTVKPNQAPTVSLSASVNTNQEGDSMVPTALASEPGGWTKRFACPCLRLTPRQVRRSQPHLPSTSRTVVFFFRVLRVR